MSQTMGTKLAYTLCDVSERRLRQLVEEGVIRQVSRGRYDLIDTVVAYVRFIRENKADADGNEKGRLIKAKAEIAQMEADLMAGRAVDLAAVESVWSDAVMRFRQKMLSIPHKLAPIVAAAGDIDECAALIEGQIYEALAELSEADVEGAGEAAANAKEGSTTREAAAAA